MLNKNNALAVAGIVFTIVALLHLARIITKVSVIFDGREIPVALNIVGFIITSLLAIWMYYAAKQK